MSDLKDGVSMTFAGENMQVVVRKMFDFLNSLKGLNLINQADIPPQAEPTPIKEEKAEE